MDLFGGLSLCIPLWILVWIPLWIPVWIPRWITSLDSSLDISFDNSLAHIINMNHMQQDREFADVFTLGCDAKSTD